MVDRLSLGVAFVAALLSFHCGNNVLTVGYVPSGQAQRAESGIPPTDDAGPPPEDAGDNDAGGGPFGPFTGRGADGSGGYCTAAAKLIYVVTDTNILYSFDPSKLAGQPFTVIGAVPCVVPRRVYVNSMAIDRHGTAWVNYSNGAIFQVSTSAPIVCQPTSFVPLQAGFSDVLGMGFSSDSLGSNTETLFVSDNNGLGLGKIDLSTMTLTPLGRYTGKLAGFSAELTGTGDGNLYGIFTTYGTGQMASIAQIDKTNGATPSVTGLPTVNASNGGYAFSFWGGDFWFYTAYPTLADPNATTSVTHFQPSTQMANVVLSNIGFTIVGAGVSTCAPTTIPR
jgi:hypothetical protein